MIPKYNKSQNKHLHGFTLIELSIVLVISSFLLIGGLEAFDVYRNNRLLIETRERQELIVTSLSRFKDRMTSGVPRGRYPCPADPSLHFNDPLSGVENCVPALAVGACSGGGTVGICKVLGARDTIADPDINPDIVLIGAVPYKSLQDVGEIKQNSIGYSSIQSSQDSWGYQMTYAISDYLTRKPTYDSQHGSISVITELGINLLSPPNSAHYALIGHGANHVGAYTAEGTRPVPCSVGDVESDNCTPNSTFVKGLYSKNNNANYYDDTVWYTSFSISKLWGFSALNPDDIYNLNAGNVGFGTTAMPTERLEVKGDIRANEIRQDLLCDKSPIPVCWDPENLASVAGTQCSTGGIAPGNIRIVNRVVGAQVQCVDIPMLQVLASQTCAVAGEYIIGFDQLGNIICEVP